MFLVIRLILDIMTEYIILHVKFCTWKFITCEAIINSLIIECSYIISDVWHKMFFSHHCFPG